MQIAEAVVGTRVVALVEFFFVPAQTEGVIDEDYGTGVTVAWDLPRVPLPSGYKAYDPILAAGLLLDKLDKERELHLVARVRSPEELRDA